MKPKHINVEISLTTILMIAGLILGSFVLWEIKGVFFMMFMAFIFSSALRPFVDNLESRKVPRLLSVSLVYIAVILFIVIALVTIVSQTVQQFNLLSSELPTIIDRLGDIVSSFLATVVNVVNNLPGVTDIDANNVKSAITEFVNNINLNDVSTIFSGGVSGAINIINSAFSVLTATFIILILAAYMLIRKENVYSGLLNALPISLTIKYELLLKQIEEQMGRWLRGQMILVFWVGFLTWLGLFLPSLFLESYTLHKFALPMAFLAAILELIPTIGPMATGVIGILIAAGASLGSPAFQIVYVIVLFTLIQQFENVYLVPKVMEKVIGLDPIVTIISVLSAFTLFQIFGAILIIPLLAIVQIVLKFEREYQPVKYKLKTKT